MLILRIFLTIILAGFSLTAVAAPKVVITKIKADFIVIKRNDGVIYLDKNVVIDRDDLNVLAQHMEVYFDENKKVVKDDSKSSAIKKIIASDHVKIFNEEFVANGDIGTFDPANDNFILEKNVVFNRGSSVAHGEKFIYNLKTKKGNLVGQKLIDKDNQKVDSDGRVTVIINDSDFKKSKQK